MRPPAMALLFLLGSCGEAANEGRPRAAERSATPPEEVVARVGDEVITLGDVQDLVDATRLSPREALVRLEEERLLYAYALRQGVAVGGFGEREERRALVRALLTRAVEAGRMPEDISMEQIAARFAETRVRFEKPARRVVTHLLFEPGREGHAAAKEAAERELARLSRLPGDEALAELERRPAKSEQGALRVRREAIPEVRLGGPLDDGFEAAAFSRPGVGLVPELARSRKGFHILYVKELLDPVVLRLEDHEQRLREQLSIEAREQALAALLAELEEKTRVEKAPEQIKHLERDEILGSGR